MTMAISLVPVGVTTPKLRLRYHPCAVSAAGCDSKNNLLLPIMPGMLERSPLLIGNISILVHVH